MPHPSPDGPAGGLPGGRAAEERGGQSRPPRLHLITGLAGQDGTLLARHLLALGERVLGTATSLDDPRLPAGVPVVELDIRETAAFASIFATHRPDVVHNLAALSSVGASWDDPALTDEVNHRAVLGLLDVVGDKAAFVQASSSEIFGPAPVVEQPEERGRPVETTPPRFDERTPLNPASPYAEAKAAAHEAVVRARAAGGQASNLILFGHTSPLHDERFVLPTIARQAADIALGRRATLELRDPSVARDWGSAVDFVRAFALASAAPADDFVIATGHLHRLADVATWALEAAGADADSTVRASGEAARRSDFGGVVGDASHAADVLGWQPEVTLRDTITDMVRALLPR